MQKWILIQTLVDTSQSYRHILSRWWFIVASQVVGRKPLLEIPSNLGLFVRPAASASFFRVLRGDPPPRGPRRHVPAGRSKPSRPRRAHISQARLWWRRRRGPRSAHQRVLRRLLRVQPHVWPWSVPSPVRGLRRVQAWLRRTGPTVHEERSLGSLCALITKPTARQDRWDKIRRCLSTFEPLT